jgi:Predicted P-loop ATPase
VICFRINGHPIREWKWYLLYALKVMMTITAIISTYFVSESLNKWWCYKIKNCWHLLDKLYILLNDHYILTLFFSLSLIGCVVFYVWRNHRDRFFSLPFATCSSIACIFLIKQDSWTYARTMIPFLRYNWLIAAIIATLILWSFQRLFEVKKRLKSRKRELIFMVDHTDAGIQNDCRDAYAHSLVNQLLLTVSNGLCDEAFAVAITGGWGTGKTVFLNKMKKWLKGKAIIVDFKPWNSQDERHLVKDFFETLTKELSPYYSGIESPMKKYVSMLYSMKMHINSDMILQHLPQHQPEDIESKKKNIEDALTGIGKPIVVTIDDLDRLEAKEIFEVMRIIRNTAQFKKVVYVVTYDKEYITEQLKSELHVSVDYLEKIFQLELSMPKVDEKDLEESFRICCRAMSSRTSLMNQAHNLLKEKDYQHIIKSLNSYRKIRRFARQFTFNSNFMLASFGDSNLISIFDTMLLNIIQMLDDTLYDVMWKHPETLFDEKAMTGNCCIYYQLKDHLDKTGWHEEAIYFIERLFGSEPSKAGNGIQMKDSYYKYFNLNQPGKELTAGEFEDMLKKPNNDAHNGMRTRIRWWVLSKDSKSVNSIYRQFQAALPTMHQKVDDEEKAKKLIATASYWLEYEYRSLESVIQMLCQVLNSAIYDNGIKDCIKIYAKNMMTRIVDLNQYEKMARVYAYLYEHIEKGNRLLIEKNEIRRMINDDFSRLADYQIWDAILLKRDDGNMLRETVDKCSVKDVQNGLQLNLMIDAAIAYFSQPMHKSNNTKEAHELKDAIKIYMVHGSKASPDYDWPHLETTFGRDLKKLEEFIEKCFN